MYLKIFVHYQVVPTISSWMRSTRQFNTVHIKLLSVSRLHKKQNFKHYSSLRSSPKPTDTEWITSTVPVKRLDCSEDYAWVQQTQTKLYTEISGIWGPHIIFYQIWQRLQKLCPQVQHWDTGMFHWILRAVSWLHWICYEAHLGGYDYHLL